MRWEHVWVVAGVLAGCTKANPDYCDEATECRNGYVCVLDANTCIPRPDADVLACHEVGQSAECTDPTSPICEDGQCQPCEANSDCDSAVCLETGACQDPSRVVYLASDGMDVGTCEQQSPCSTPSFAFALTSAQRDTIKVGDGVYTTLTTFIVEPPQRPSLIVVGDGPTEAAINNTGTALFDVRGGATAEVRGLSLQAGLRCDGSSLIARNTSIDSNGNNVAGVNATNCMVTIEDATLSRSTDAAVKLTVDAAGNATIRRSSITGNTNGVMISGGPATVVLDESVISDSDDYGVLWNVGGTGRLFVHRCLISFNARGGITASGVGFDITNNLVFRNGDNGTSANGGIRVNSIGAVGPANLVAYNTVAFNRTPLGSGSAGGIMCAQTLDNARNNIVYNNFSGASNTAGDAQTVGACDFTGSVIRNGDGTNELHFRSITMPFDFHLADDLGPASGAAVLPTPPTVPETDVDFDGEPRPAIAPDVGADEFYP